MNEDKIIALVQEYNKSFDRSQINIPIEHTCLDSMDILSIRVDIEKQISYVFPDSEWYEFKSLNDIIEYCNNADLQIDSSNDEIGKQSIQKNYEINLPQMANYALSENWLFKELGNTHWELLCRGLEKKSSLITDNNNNRLYATFVRIKTQLTCLRKFKENQDINIEGEIFRYGKNNYNSKFNYNSDDYFIGANFMTTFSKRETEDNLELIQCSPSVNKINIPELNEKPDFLIEYIQLKKSLAKSHELSGVQFSVSQDNKFEINYKINPYYDLNGVGLLYFAAYPVISDYCESIYFNSLTEIGKWEDEYFTTARDIFYFANCNINDEIKYILNEYEYISENRVKIRSMLVRCADKKIMANIFTIKEKYES